MTYQFEYKRVRVASLEEIEYAEQLMRYGWKVIHGGMFTALLERRRRPGDIETDKPFDRLA